MIKIKLILVFFLYTYNQIIKLIEAESSTNDAYNCSDFSPETRNITCCKSLDIFKSNYELLNLCQNKMLEFERENAQKIAKANDSMALKTCIYHKYLVESAGFYVDEKFNRAKFNALIMNNTDYAENVEKIIEIFDKCVIFVADLKVKEIQEREIAIKPEDCNFEPQILNKCIVNHFKAVSLNAK